MSRADYLTVSTKLTGRPCKLLSIIVGNDGSNIGHIDVYNARNANEADKMVRLYGAGKSTEQYRWVGLELDKGLYVKLTYAIEWVTVEWEHQEPHIEV